MNIEEILVKAGINFKETYRYFIVKCPYHIDVHPSLKIYKDSNMVHCYSCGYHSSLKSFLKNNYSIKNCDINSLSTIVVRQSNKHPMRLIVKLPIGYTLLKLSIPKLKITEEIIKNFDIGYCKYGYNSKINDKCKKCYFYDLDKPVKERRWVTNSNYCFFAQQRIMTPISMGGILYSIESRDMSEKSSKKVLYPHLSKSSLTIFNYDNLNGNKPLYVVEGIKGALRIWKDIDKNVTAIFSNRLKGDQAKLLSNFKHIKLIPDNGYAGDQTVGDFKKLKGVKLEVIKLPKIVLCKNCGLNFRGNEKKDLCPKCGSIKNSYCDIFDFKTSTLKELLGTSVSAIKDLLKKMGKTEKIPIKVRKKV